MGLPYMKGCPVLAVRLATITSTRICGQHFTIEHALSCSRGGFPSIRHNEIRNITADLLSGVCHSIGTLQPVTGEQFEHTTANREDGARLDIVAQSFRQSAFFDVRVFNPFAPCYRSSTLAQCYRKNELEKKRAYEERVREIEHSSFSPLVFSAAGGMGPIATVVYKRLASLLFEKQGRAYSSTLHWLRCRLNFSLLRSAIMCIRAHDLSSPQNLHPHPLSPLTWPFMKARYQHFKPPEYHFLCFMFLFVCFFIIEFLFTRCYIAMCALL